MHVTPRSYLTSGIAVLGVGAIALAPVQPIPNQIALAPERVISTLAVELAASTIDPITPWVQTFETAAANVGTLVEFYLQKPFPILQTIGANIGTYFEELGNGNAGLIPEQIWGNIQTFFQAPWDPGSGLDIPSPPLPEPVFLSTGEYVSDTGVPSPNNTQAILPATIAQLALGAFETCDLEDENCELPGQIAPVTNFLNNHYSGQVLGLLGTLLSPFVQLVESFTAVGEFFEAGDVIGAINELINIPANMTNAFLNGGGYLDLTAIAEQFLPVPPGSISYIGVNLGGLLNVVPVNGSLVDPEDPPTEYSGGTGYDGVAAKVGPLPFQGLPIGWVGSVIGLGQFVAEQMVVTPPAPPGTPPAAPPVAAEPEAAKLAAPADISAVTEATAEESAPAVVDTPAEESAPDVAAEVAEDPAPANQTEVEETALADLEVTEAQAPAVAEDSAPEPAAAVGSDDSGDSGSQPGDSRRGAADAG